jgi:hypothetical protein
VSAPSVVMCPVGQWTVPSHSTMRSVALPLESRQEPMP